MHDCCHKDLIATAGSGKEVGDLMACAASALISARFVSYAQNFEDLMLYRALRDVKQGFYIDVGACDPVTHSVTKAFYDRNWRGINIEPATCWFDKLRAQRSRDINLRVLAWSRSAEVPFFEIAETGLSTSNRAQACAHEKAGFVVHERRAQALPLAEICRKYAPAEVHFLKIDVEGSEKETLDGLDLRVVRPWIIVVESTQPLTAIDVSKRWQRILLRQKYSFCYFDGLNRFYAANERPHLKKLLAVPPSHLDGFVLHRDLLEAQSACAMHLAEMRETAELMKNRHAVINKLLAQLRSSSPVSTAAAERYQIAPAIQPFARGGWYEEQRVGGVRARWSGPGTESWLDFDVPAFRNFVFSAHIIGALRQDQIDNLLISINGEPTIFDKSENDEGGMHLEVQLPHDRITTREGRLRLAFHLHATMHGRDVLPGCADNRLLGILMGRAELIPVN